jgi:thioester reductase-like protein
MTRKKDAPGILFTGFPGFIGARLIPRLIELRPGAVFHCLVQPRFLDLAQSQIRDIEKKHKHAKGHIEIVVGDITQQGLGLEAPTARELHAHLVGAYHLAAVYDLAVERQLGRKINVEGTRNVLEFLGEAKHFEKLDYVSTAYVSGSHTGVFRETDLDVGQGFKNHYEETKFQAELEVVRSKLPFTTYRPGIVVGDSKTGETAKFDGPYYALAAMERLPSPGAFIRIGTGGTPVNVVPVDFVIEAMAQLSASAVSKGKTYHLTGHEPPSSLEIAQVFAKLIGKSFVFVPVPAMVARTLLGPRPVQRFLGLPVQSLDYFDNPCQYDASQATKDLARLGVACPRFADYAPKLVEFWKQKKSEVRRTAMI